MVLYSLIFVYIIQVDNIGDFMENNVVITVTQRQDQQEQQVIYSGAAQYSESALGKYIKYIEEDGTVTNVRFTDQLCWILRKGVYESKVLLHVEQESKIKMKTEYGELHFDAQLASLIATEDEWKVKYYLLQNDEVISVFEFTWMIKEALA